MSSTTPYPEGGSSGGDGDNSFNPFKYTLPVGIIHSYSESSNGAKVDGSKNSFTRGGVSFHSIGLMSR